MLLREAAAPPLPNDEVGRSNDQSVGHFSCLRSHTWIQTPFSSFSVEWILSLDSVAIFKCLAKYTTAHLERMSFKKTCYLGERMLLIQIYE